MIFYTETKTGKKSVYSKIVLDSKGKEVTRRDVEIPLYVVEKDNQHWFVLYDDDMNVLSLPFIYLNFEIHESFNTKKASANALRLLYVFLSLSNYNIDDFELEQLSALIYFLRGINSNPVNYQTITTRTNETINGYLSVYRRFFMKHGIKSNALFDNRRISEEVVFVDESLGRTERTKYINSLQTYNMYHHSVPKYISPDEFDTLYSFAYQQKDLLAMCMMRLMYCYGLRLGEVLGLTIEDLKETHRDNVLVPILLLRNRKSDKNFQYAKNLAHVEKTSQYKSREYSKNRHEIIIDYPLYELLCDYINQFHLEAMEKYPKNYELGEADVVSVRDIPESNHYIFLNKYGRVLTGQTWGKKLKTYFIRCNIPIDYNCRENNLSHRFRHGFAMLHAHYRRDPVDAFKLQDMMRHRSISSTMIYYNPTPEEIHKIKEEFFQNLCELIPSLKEGMKQFEQ